VIAPGERVVCILTAHQLKDPTATVAYHTADPALRDELLRHGVERAPFSNKPVAVPNELHEILRAIEEANPHPVG
jgi:threonine synthase